MPPTSRFSKMRDKSNNKSVNIQIDHFDKSLIFSIHKIKVKFFTFAEQMQI